MDDASSRSPSTSRLRLPLWVALSALIGAGAALLSAPLVLPDSVPLFAARVGGLVERGARPGEIRERLLASYARAVAAREATGEERRRRRSALRTAMPEGPIPVLAPSTRCASILRGWVTALHSLTGISAATPGLFPAALDVPLEGPSAAVESAARAGDPAALADAFAIEQQTWRRALGERARQLPSDRRAELWGEWRVRLEARARELDRLATMIEIGLESTERPLVPLGAILEAPGLEARMPDPSDPLREHPAAPATFTLRPVPAALIPVGLAGALLGALSGLAMASLVRAGRGGRSHRDDVHAWMPVEPRAWLQLVSGPSRRLVARGVFELAARALARAERVVIVDLSPGLRLHEPLGLSSSLGWMECARARLPALGVIQNGGFTGLFLLAHGRPGRAVNWLALDRVLEDLRPHFGRVVLAVDRSAPALLGSVLAGRVIDAGWAGPRARRVPPDRRLGDRLSISLGSMDLSGMPEASLEAIEARMGVLLPRAVPGRWVAATGHSSSVDFVPPRISTPVVLDCDLQFSQRLRFLAWMRRIQAERQGRAPESTARS